LVQPYSHTCLSHHRARNNLENLFPIVPINNHYSLYRLMHKFESDIGAHISETEKSDIGAHISETEKVQWWS